MSNIEITLEQGLFAELEELAASLQVSPGEAIMLAVEELIKRKRSEEITRQINEAYADEPTEEELQEEQAMRRFGQRAMLKVIDEW